MQISTFEKWINKWFHWPLQKDNKIKKNRENIFKSIFFTMQCCLFADINFVVFLQTLNFVVFFFLAALTLCCHTCNGLFFLFMPPSFEDKLSASSSSEESSFSGIRIFFSSDSRLCCLFWIIEFKARWRMSSSSASEKKHYI